MFTLKCEVLTRQFNENIVLYGSTTTSDSYDEPSPRTLEEAEAGYTEKLLSILLEYSCSRILRMLLPRPDPVPPPRE